MLNLDVASIADVGVNRLRCIASLALYRCSPSDPSQWHGAFHTWPFRSESTVKIPQLAQPTSVFPTFLVVIDRSLTFMLARQPISTKIRAEKVGVGVTTRGVVCFEDEFIFWQRSGEEEPEV